MKVTVDAQRRVVLPSATPGDSFEIQASGEGTFILIPMKPAETRLARVKLTHRRYKRHL